MSIQESATKSSIRLARFWPIVFICAGGISLLAGCWDAGFLSYDDSSHISDNKTVLNGSFFELLTSHDPAYFPMTLLSYRLDLLLFSGWLPQVVGSWAPGVRFMSCVYHILAAIIIWRIMLRLGLSSLSAFIVAMVFVSHPLACETVCWISERKNSLAALFGFGAIYSSLRFQGRRWRVLLVVGLYLCAVLSKAGGLGIFPILVLVELFGGEGGLRGEAGMNWRLTRAWIQGLILIVPLLVISLIFTHINVVIHEEMLLAPPGGNLFTTLLTDLEIVSRYLWNMAVPVRLSVCYFCMPVLSLVDPRVWIYGPILSTLIFGTIYIGANRRLVIFGWLWFFGALMPNLNFIAFPHWMNDRYVYLSTPGVLLVAVQTAMGLQRRFGPWLTRILRVGVPVYLFALVALAGIRSADWLTTYTLFKSAVEAQPLSTFAHHGLGLAYAQASELQKSKPAADAADTAKLNANWREQWRISVENCPDAWRYGKTMLASLFLAEDAYHSGDLENAERYSRLVAFPPPDSYRWDMARARAHKLLARIEIRREKYMEALLEAEMAVQILDAPENRLCRASAAGELARWMRQKGAEKDALLLDVKARNDLESIPASSELYSDAQALMRSLFGEETCPKQP